MKPLTKKAIYSALEQALVSTGNSGRTDFSPVEAARVADRVNEVLHSCDRCETGRSARHSTDCSKRSSSAVIEMMAAPRILRSR